MFWFGFTLAMPFPTVQHTVHCDLESVCRFPAPIISSKQHLSSDSKDTVCHQNLMGTSLIVRGNAELTLSSRRALNRGPWKGTLTSTSTPGVGWLLCTPRAHRWRTVPNCWKSPKRKCGPCTFKQGTAALGTWLRAAPQQLSLSGQTC